MKTLIALSIIALAATSAQAQNWTSVARNAQGVDYLIKDEDRNGSTASPLIWVKTDNSREAEARWASSLSQIQFDCTRQSLQILAVHGYDAGGTVKDSQVFPLGQRRFTLIPPGSVWAEVASAVCPR